MTESFSPTTTRWSGLGYQQVPGLANRLIARYLRAQRKNMRRFFAARGMLDLLERMEQIRKSRQGMLAKNRMFQKVLDDYANRNRPPAVSVQGETNAIPQTAHPEGGGVAVDLSTTSVNVRAESTDGIRPESNGSILSLAPGDGESSGVVIEE